MPSSRIYLDYAATSPLLPEVGQALSSFYSSGSPEFSLNANANSLHSDGRRAFGVMEEARRSVANLLGARPDEIFFTSGATESDNSALLGILLAYRDRHPSDKPHMLVSAYEHDAVYSTAEFIRLAGMAEVEYVVPDTSGHIRPADIANRCRPSTVLVSCMYAQNELGSVNDIARLVCLLQEKEVLFHTDAVQALGKIPIDLHAMGVDAASFSAHKVGGPKGVGLLYLRAGTPFKPSMRGGGQEGGLRSGTQNVAGIVGFDTALKTVCPDSDYVKAEFSRLQALQDHLLVRLAEFDRVVFSTPFDNDAGAYLPNLVHVCVRGIESETLILQLDRLGFSLSAGSACSSRSLEPSRALKSINMDKDLALGALRISFGRFTTLAELDSFVDALAQVLKAD